MFKIIQNSKLILFKLIAFISLIVGIMMVNSCCNFIFYQPKEPESLKRYLKKWDLLVN